MLTIKQRAALEVARVLTLSIIVGAGTGILLNTVPLAILGIGACAVMVLYLLKMVYDSKVNELETEEKLKS